MKGQEVVLSDMLACRERRVNIQNEYIQRYHCPVISFCMNIPGPIKTNEQIKKAFLSGKEALFAVLQKENIPILTQTEFDEKTGNEIILTVDYPADKIKELLNLLKTINSNVRLSLSKSLVTQFVSIRLRQAQLDNNGITNFKELYFSTKTD